MGGFYALIGPPCCQSNLSASGAVNLAAPKDHLSSDVWFFKRKTVNMCYTSLSVPGIVYLSLLFMFPLLTSAELTPRVLEVLNQTTQVMKKVSRRETRTLPPPYLHLPVFLDSSMPLVEKEHFSPARGTGQEPLPESVREILRPVLRPTSRPPSVSGVTVKILCKLNKMHVQVSKSILGASETHSQLKLGTCRASKTTMDSLYFEYDVGMCGTKRTVSFTAVSPPANMLW